MIWPYKKPMKQKAGFLNLKGNLFDSAIMKTSVISDAFRKRYLSNPKDPNAFEGRAIVFDGPEDYHHRIDDPKLKIDDTCMLFVRGTGPVGYPGAAEVVNMQPPAELIKHGVTELPCIGDGRQSGTSGSPSILNASPEAATGGGLAILKTGDRIRIDLNKRTANILISKAEYEQPQEGAGEAGRLQDSRQPDTVAGDPARHGGRAFAGDGAQAGGQVSADCDDQGNAEGQSLDEGALVDERNRLVHGAPRIASDTLVRCFRVRALPHSEPVEAHESHAAAAHRQYQGCHRCETARDECDAAGSSYESADDAKAYRDCNGKVIGRDQDRTSFRFGCDGGFDRHVSLLIHVKKMLRHRSQGRGRRRIVAMHNVNIRTERVSSKSHIRIRAIGRSNRVGYCVIAWRLIWA